MTDIPEPKAGREVTQADIDTVVYPEEYYDILESINALSGLTGDLTQKCIAVAEVMNRHASRFIKYDDTDGEVEMYASDPRILLSRFETQRVKYEQEMEVFFNNLENA